MLTGKELINDINLADTKSDALDFWRLGQASIILKLSGQVVYIDPFLSEYDGRLIAPMLRPSDVTNADIILCTHAHEDHTDLSAIQEIAISSPKAIFVVPKPMRQLLLDDDISSHSVIGINAGEILEFGDIQIIGVAAKHEFFDQTKDSCYPYLGFLIYSENVCAYHAGDTLVYDGLVSTLKDYNITAAFLPINGRDGKRYRAGCIGNMTYQEAVDLAGEITPDVTIPIHYDMFAANSIDPVYFEDYISAKYPQLKVCVVGVGQRVKVKSTQEE